jgi:hypothetical protein
MSLEQALADLTAAVKANTELMLRALEAKPAAAAPTEAPAADDKPKRGRPPKAKEPENDEDDLSDDNAWAAYCVAWVKRDGNGTPGHVARRDIAKAIPVELGIERISATPVKERAKVKAWLDAFDADGSRPNFMADEDDV